VTLHSFTHVAVRVESLREAEAFYCDLFKLDVAWREAETSDGWRTLPNWAGWSDAERAGIDLGLVMLYRDGLRLALERADRVSKNGLLSHLGVFADEEELERLRRSAAAAGCEIVSDREGALVFDDPFGARWEANTFDYDDPPSMSTGARSGTWIELKPPDYLEG
jgi:catechol 2,3-dioxygenase-like lactoylglutathione lyase family enzyme